MDNQHDDDQGKSNQVAGDDALLASVMRKILTVETAGTGRPYFALYSESACIDGWVEQLTPDEVEAIRRVRPEVWDMPNG